MRHAALVTLLATALAAGCTAGGPNRSERPWFSAFEPVKSESDNLLEYYAKVVRLKGQELAREYDAVHKAYEKEQIDTQRIQLAMLLSLPNSGFRDDAAALALIQPLLRDTRNELSALRPMATLIYVYLIELRRIDEQMQSQNARLRDEQRRTDEQLQSQNAKLRDEQRRAEALQQKLEALLEMEMKMIEREQSAQKRKR